MGLKDVIQAVNAALPGSWQKLFGDEQLAYEGSPPRVTWVLAQEPITPMQPNRGGQPGALWTRHPLAVLHIWGAKLTEAGAPDEAANVLDHLEACEQMAAKVVQTLQTLFTQGGYQLDNPAQWNVARGVVRLGVVYLLPITFLMPFTRAQDEVATVAGVDMQMQSQRPGAAAENGPLVTMP